MTNQWTARDERELQSEYTLSPTTETDMRRQLIQVLGQIQNDPAHECHDIMTFAAFLNEPGELENHIAANFEQAVRHMRRMRWNGRRYVKRATKKAA